MFPCCPNGWRGPMKGLGWLGGPPCWFKPTIPWWPWWGGRLGLGGSLGNSPSGPWPGWLKAGPGGPKPMWPWLGSCCCCCWWRLLLLFIRGLGPWWSNTCCPGNRVDSERSVPKQSKQQKDNRDVSFVPGHQSLLLQMYGFMALSEMKKEGKQPLFQHYHSEKPWCIWNTYCKLCF